MDEDAKPWIGDMPAARRAKAACETIYHLPRFADWAPLVADAIADAEQRARAGAARERLEAAAAALDAEGAQFRRSADRLSAKADACEAAAAIVRGFIGDGAAQPAGG